MDYTPVEASMIDGAGGLTLYTKVILPLLRPTIIVVLLMSLVNSFKVFDSIWVMTKGGLTGHPKLWRLPCIRNHLSITGWEAALRSRLF